MENYNESLKITQRTAALPVDVFSVQEVSHLREWDGRVVVKDAPQSEFSGYFQGSLGELLVEIQRRKSHKSEILASMRNYFAQKVHPDLDMEKILKGAWSQFDHADLVIAIGAQILKPDVLAHATSAMTHYLNRKGVHSVVVNGQYDVDLFTPDDPDGLKPTYVEPVMLSTNHGPHPHIFRSRLVASNDQQLARRTLGTIEVTHEHDGLRRALQGRLRRDGVGEGSTIRQYHNALAEAAGITITNFNRNEFDARWLPYLFLSDKKPSGKLKDALFYELTADGYQTKITFDVLYNQYAPQMKALYAQGRFDDMKKIMERYRPSARLYYRLIPAYLALYSHPGVMLFECFEVSDDFQEMVLKGMNELQQATHTSPLLVEDAWLSETEMNGNGTVEVGINQPDTAFRDQLTSVTIPMELFDPQVRARYLDYIYASLDNTFGDHFKDATLTDIHKESLRATVEFLYVLASEK